MHRRAFVSLLVLLAILAGMVPAAMVQAQGPVPQTPPPQTPQKPPDGGTSAGTADQPQKAPPPDIPADNPVPLPPGVDAVATGYDFSSLSGTYTEISGGTQVTTVCDDQSYGTYAIGFTFTYDGVAYTTFGIQCNGFIAMGASPSSSYTPISTGATNNVISALGGDLQTNTTNSEIRYQTLGSAPNQTLVVQYKNFRPYNATGYIYNFQIILYQTSNKVEVVYGSFTSPGSYTRQVGLRGASNADYNNRMTDATHYWANSLRGTANSSTMTLSSTYLPGNGLTYDWAIHVPAPNFTTSRKIAPAEIVGGSWLTYTVAITNSGDLAGNGTMMTDTIPAGTTYRAGSLSCPGAACSYDAGNNRILYTGDFAVGTSRQATFAVDTAGVGCGSTIANSAWIKHAPSGAQATVTANSTVVSTLPFLSESFDGVTFPPTGWTAVILSGTYNWVRSTSGTYPTIMPHSGLGMVFYNSYNATAGSQARLATPVLTLPANPTAVSFYLSHDTGYPSNNDNIQPQISTDGGGSWTNLGAAIPRYDAAYTTPGWGLHSRSLADYAGMSNVRIGFLATSAYGNNMYLDDVKIAAPWYPCPYVSLDPSSSSRRSCPLSMVNYPLTVYNANPVTDTLDIAITSVWPAVANPNALTLGPGGTGLVTVTVDLPWDAFGASDTATVVATGQGSGLSDSALLTTYGSTQWVAAAAAPAASTSMDNVVIEYNDELYLMGGYGMTTPAKYDPATDSWTTLAAEPTTRIAYAEDGCFGFNDVGDPVIVLFPDVSSGVTVLHRYNIATNAWDTPAVPAPIPSAGMWAPDIVSDRANNVCYISGGATVAGAGNLNTLYAYYPDTNTAVSLAPMTSVRDFHASWLYNGMVCVGGGNNGTAMNSTQCYDIATNTWAPENATLGPLPYPNWGSADAEKWVDGVEQLWFMGGVDTAGALDAQTAFYDTATGTWAVSAPLNSAVYRVEGDMLTGDVYVVGGSTGGFSPSTYNQHHIQCQPAEPDITVDPTSLWAAQCADTVTEQPLYICNLGGTAPLNWDISELSETLALGEMVQVTLPAGPASAPANTAVATGPYSPRPATSYTVTRRAGINAPLNVLLLAADDDNTYGSPIQTELQAFGDLGAVDLYDPRSQTPSLGDLLPYDVVIVWSNYTFADATAIGNVLADYVDAGGKVIDMMFALDPGWGYQGRFRTGNYSAFTITSYTFALECLGTYDPNHPVMSDPTPITNVCEYYRGTGTALTAGSTAIAHFTGGEIFVGVKDNQTVVTINGYVGYYRQFTGQMPDLVHNAIWWLAGTPPYDVPWLSEDPTSGQTWIDECQTVTVSFDSTGLTPGMTYTAGLLVSSDDPDTPAITVPVTLYVQMPPVIEVTAPPLWAELCPDSTDVITFTICNVGECDLFWELHEMTPSLVLAGSMPFVPVDVTGAGINPGLTLAGPAVTPVAVPAANPQDVLWDQPLSAVDQNAYVDQEFSDFPDYSSFLADDFTNPDAWEIHSIFVPGDGWNGFTTIMNADSLTWQIYADNGGVPDGDPTGRGNPPVWTLTLPPNDPQVVVTNGTPGGYPSNVQLNLDTPPTLPSGDWWLIFYPAGAFSTFGQYGRQAADTTNGYTAQFVNPGGGFGLGTEWQDWTILGSTQHDIAFRIEGVLPIVYPDFPWVSESPLSGIVPGGECATVDVLFDSTGMMPGDYFADLLILSSDPVEPAITLPMTMTVDEPVGIVDVTYTVNNLVVTFTAGVSGTEPFEYLWDFGDGMTSTEVLPVHTYAEGGCYTATLDVMNACGVDTWTDQVCVCEPLHDADFSWYPPTPIVSETVYFTGTAAGTGPVNYDWDFGDGGMGNGQYVNHAYVMTGTYTVIMTATGACGDPLVVSYDVTVASGCVPPAGADFDWTPITPTAGANVDFSGSLMTGTSPLAYAWDFGDGNTGSGQNVTHVFALPGTYDVVMTVTNGCGDVTAMHTVTVIGTCEPVANTAFTWSPPTPQVGEDVTFDATADGTGPISFAWDFGDGGTGSGATVVHAYAAEGAYDVVVTATNGCGEDTVMHTVTVVSGCVAPADADFTWLPLNPTAGQAVSFDGTLGQGTTPLFYTWDFGDGGGASGSLAPSYTYANAGTFTVTLVVTNTCGTTMAAHVLTVQPAGPTMYYLYLPIVARP